jgi:hypothetical protein
MAQRSDLELGITANTAGFSSGLGQASGALKGFKEHASKARGAGMMFAGALSSIGGASKGASAIVGHLLGGFATGGPMGLAIGGVNALVAAIQETGRAEAEAAKKSADAATKRIENYEKAATALARLRFIESGGSGGAFDARQQTEVARLGQTQAQDELDAARERLGAVINRTLNPGQLQAYAAGTLTLDKLAKHYSNLRDEIVDVQQAEIGLARATGHLDTVRRSGALEQQKAATDALTVAERELNATFAAQADLADKSLDALAKHATDAALAENRARV